MSSVPAARNEYLSGTPRKERREPALTAASLRVAPTPLDLYPTLVAALRAAFRNGRSDRRLGRSSQIADLGRATGARV